MNPSGQPGPGQNNFPPQQPQQGGYPPAPNSPNGSWAPQNPATPQQPFPQQIPPAQSWGQPNPYQQGPMPQPDPYAQPGPQQYEADYLDQIAPGAGGPKLFSGSFTWIIIGLAVLFMFAVGLIALSSGNNNTASAEAAYLRLGNFVTLTDNYRRFIKSSTLSATNTNFKIFMTGAGTDLANILAQNGVDTTKISKELKEKEASTVTDITGKLEDARLNATLDRVYAREMAYQAELLLTLYDKMSKNNVPAIRDNAKKAIGNLTPIQKSFAEFDETK